jgi:hypothetical protein
LKDREAQTIFTFGDVVQAQMLCAVMLAPAGMVIVVTKTLLELAVNVPSCIPLWVSHLIAPF